MEKYSYYIKTEKELIDEFNIYSLRDLPETDWVVPSMDYLHGMKLDLNKYKEFLINGRLVLEDNPIEVDDIPNDDFWWIRKDVIKEVSNIPNYNNTRKLVYENKNFMYTNNVSKEKTPYPYRFKTEKEFTDEFGEYWRGVTGWCAQGHMDYLIGKDYNSSYNEEFLDKQSGDYFFDSKYISNYIQGHWVYDDWSINKLMIIKNDGKAFIDYNKPRQLVYENKILKFNKF